MCNLTREEREFSEKVHIDVEENDAEKHACNDAAGKTKSQRYIKSLIKSCLFSKIILNPLFKRFTDNHIIHHF